MEKIITVGIDLAKDIKTEADLNRLSQELMKLTVETALNAELTEHLGYEKVSAQLVMQRCAHPLMVVCYAMLFHALPGFMG